MLFEGEPFLWFDTLAAAQAVYNESGEQARACILNEFAIIRRNESLDFTSGYSWVTILFRFSRKRGDDVRTAEARVQGELQDESNVDIGQRLRCRGGVGGRASGAYRRLEGVS